MKISILTHLLEGNYGGMLQAYALYKTIESFNPDISFFSYNRPKHQANVYSRLRRLLMNMVRRDMCTQADKMRQVAGNFKYLVGIANRFAPLSSEIDAFVVGSDQVWRCEYARALQSTEFFFLGTTSQHQIRNSISYAASFGSDCWEGTSDETKECSRLIHDFKAISLREHSGVKICKEVFGVDAVQMPDPTLLLYTSDYEKIIASEETWLPERKYVAAYVLDETAGKAQMLLDSAGRLGLLLQHLMPHTGAKKRRDRFPISVPQWLRLIRDCDYFITDSFHGCVFAIIYNIPFACLGNAWRGNARFDTLLGTFGLEDRLVTDATPEKVLQILNTPIDWAKVNAIHDAERERGINFLKENLT